MTSEYELRPATADEHDEFHRLFATAMMFEGSSDDRDRQLFEPERALVAVDGERIVGTTKAMTRDLSVPGAVVPAAHVTAVGVRATHRRRGILSGLMGRQLREVPEALAVLWASEPGIYGRFGYAAASWVVSYDADLRRVSPHPVSRTVAPLDELSADEAPEQLMPLFRRYQEQRPGVSGRSELKWRKLLEDKPDERNGQTARQILVHRDETGAVDGYALWRGKIGWEGGDFTNQVSLQELVAVDPVAYRFLWHHLMTVDLAGKLEFGHAALDEPVQQLVANPIALHRELRESLWIRLTDVPRALTERRYAVGLDVVIEVTDELLGHNNGRFHLTGDLSTAACGRTEAAADLSLSVTELAAAYLGGRPLTEFAATGRVTEHTPGALAAATAAFNWPVAPLSIEIF